MILFQQFKINSRFIIETIQMGDGRQLYQILITLLVFGEQYQMIRPFVDFGALIEVAVSRKHKLPRR